MSPKEVVVQVSRLRHLAPPKFQLCDWPGNSGNKQVHQWQPRIPVHARVITLYLPGQRGESCHNLLNLLATLFLVLGRVRLKAVGFVFELQFEFVAGFRIENVS